MTRRRTWRPIWDTGDESKDDDKDLEDILGLDDDDLDDDLDLDDKDLEAEDLDLDNDLDDDDLDDLDDEDLDDLDDLDDDLDDLDDDLADNVGGPDPYANIPGYLLAKRRADGGNSPLHAQESRHTDQKIHTPDGNLQVRAEHQDGALLWRRTRT